MKKKTKKSSIKNAPTKNSGKAVMSGMKFKPARSKAKSSY